jgi:hypothetical protein
MPLFSRTKNYADGDILTAADLMAELDNIITNLTPAMINDESATTSAMRATDDPYGSSTEAPAESLQEEIKQLRYLIKQLSGQPYWYVDPNSVSFSVHKNTTNQAGLTTSDWTQITFSTELFDTNSNFATNAFTPTVAGKYLLSAAVGFTSSEDTRTYGLGIYKNGALAHVGSSTSSGVTGATVQATVTAIVDANGSSDVFTLYAFHDATAATASGAIVSTWFSGARLGPT